MKRFEFKGELAASKSILNRLLVIRSFASELVIEGDSTADDVAKMKSGLRQLLAGEPADCGAAGTTLRFLALRASRLSGTHHLSGSLRLFERPQEEIARLLGQLGAEAEIRLQRLTVRGSGWREPASGEILVDRSISSQFASALLLNAWDLPFDLRVRMQGRAVSEPYLAMTIELLTRAGMKLEKAAEDLIVVPRNSQVQAKRLAAEIDVSSAFAIAALAAATAGHVEIQRWPNESLQPDSVFASILSRMGCRVDEGDSLTVSREASTPLRAVDCDLEQCPDLFPSLAVLCAVAEGTSRLSGAPHLAHKESDRIAKTAELIKALGRRVRPISGGLEIDGLGRERLPQSIRFDTDHDHRLAMAAAIAKAAGAGVVIGEPSVVSKSFPGFWTIFEQGLAT